MFCKMQSGIAQDVEISFHIVLAVKVYKLDEFVINFSDCDCDCDCDTDCDSDRDLDQLLAVGKR